MEVVPTLNRSLLVEMDVGLPRLSCPAVTEYRLRRVVDSDASEIIALIRSVWSEYPGKILVAETDMPELLTPATSYARSNGCFWVVEAKGRLIGTIALNPSAEPGVVELQKLYVAKDARRTGLGTFLCRLVEVEALRRGASAVELWSDVKLLDAHRRYERLDYRRGEALKLYDDTSATVRYYYRKELRRWNPIPEAQRSQSSTMRALEPAA